MFSEPPLLVTTCWAVGKVLDFISKIHFEKCQWISEDIAVSVSEYQVL